MTTITCDGESLAADGLETTGDVITGRHVKKLWKLDDGRIVGFAGEVVAIHRLLTWLKDRPSKMPNVKGATALLLQPNGKVLMYENSCLSSPAEVPASIGTGYIAALAALDMGATSAEAVRIAMKRDVYSGGTVQVLNRGG